ncbi:MAG: hypothetical protein ACOX43_05810 [Bacilli bacterium]
MKKTKAIAVYICALILSFVCVFPFLWMVISGFKTKADILTTPFRFFPKVWTFDNYLKLFVNQVDTYLFPRDASFFRSLFVTFGVSIISNNSNDYYFVCFPKVFDSGN